MREQLSYIRGFLQLLAIPLLFFSLCRLLFLLFNLSYFEDFPISAFFFGLQFDLSSLASFFAPFTFFYLLPHPFRFKEWYQTLIKTSWRVGFLLTLTLNCIDFEYFKFTLKRSTSDLFQLIGYGDDFTTLLPTFIKDFWYVVLVWGFFILLGEYLFRKVSIQGSDSSGWKFYSYSSLNLVLATLLTVLALRGGFQLKPIKMINAGSHVEAQYIPLVLNTPFSIFSTFNQPSLSDPAYYKDGKHESVFSPVIQFEEGEFQQKNVVLIILESFSTEFVGYLNPYEGYTPFLDSLMGESMVFTRCFANGQKSIDGIPSILSGLPTLMTQPYISSPYSANQINSLASALGGNGYETSFYHGGSNGTMGFNAFTQTAGFDKYIGRLEYNNEDDFDGNWGIFDEPFFQFYAKELSESKAPFFSTFFTLSSHHPFTIPEQHKDRFKEGPYPIHKTILYTDYSLRKFFERIKTKPWFEHTLFVLTADHTAASASPFYKTMVGRHAIPLVFFDPGNPALKGKVSEITQQSDIFPSVLDYLNWEGTAVAFGQSVFDRSYPPFAINYLNGIYQLIEDGYAYQFDGDKGKALYRFEEDLKLKKNILKKSPEKALEMEKRLKAIIQGYNLRMMENKLSER